MLHQIRISACVQSLQCEDTCTSDNRMNVGMNEQGGYELRVVVQFLQRPIAVVSIYGHSMPSK